MKPSRSRRKVKSKPRPINEITEQDLQEFSRALSEFKGYPRLRDLPRVLQGMNIAKINTIIRFLERSGSIVIDTEGYIIWSRDKAQEDSLSFAQVANISDDAKALFKGHEE